MSSPGHIEAELANFYDLTQTRAAKLWEKEGRKCHWCKTATVLTKHTIPNQATEDHVIPRGSGGSNDEENVVSACLRCNGRRNSEHSKGLSEGKLIANPPNRPYERVLPRDLELERIRKELTIARWRYEQEHKKVIEFSKLTFWDWLQMKVYINIKSWAKSNGETFKWKDFEKL